MKVLFTCGEVVERVGGSIYAMSIPQHVSRYSYLGEVTCACNVRNVSSSTFPLVEDRLCDFVYFERINTLLKKLKYSIENQKKMEKLLKNYDILVAHVPSELSYYAIAASMKYKIPYISVVVGCPFDSLWNYDWRGKILAIPAYFKLKNIMRQSKYSIYVTQKFLQCRYPTSGKQVGISDVCIASYDRMLLENRIEQFTHYSSLKGLKLVTVAAIDVSYKGQQYVIDAMNILNNKLGYDFHYYLIGSGDSAYLSQLAMRYNLSSNVHFVGPLPHEKVLQFLTQMDVYVQPSKQEGLPRSVVEAMSCALPALGSDIAGIPELIDRSFLFKKGCVKEIVNILQSMLSRDVLISQSKINFKKSQEYTNDVLDKKRKQFFNNFINDNDL